MHVKASEMFADGLEVLLKNRTRAIGPSYAMAAGDKGGQHLTRVRQSNVLDALVTESIPSPSMELKAPLFRQDVQALSYHSNLLIQWHDWFQRSGAVFPKLDN